MTKEKRRGELLKVERIEISILKKKGYSIRSIATELGRSPNSVSYEIRNNSVNGIYDPIKAHAKAHVKKKARRYNYQMIERYPKLKGFIIAKLKEHWNPDEIAGYLKRTKPKDIPYVSKSAIYLWLRTSRGEQYCKYLYSGRAYVKKHKKKTKRTLIPNRIGIEERPKGAKDKSRYGHVEADAVVSRKGCKGALTVHMERKSRLIGARVVRSMKPQEHLDATLDIYKNWNVKSVTYDNGIENRYHEQVGVPTFFCDAYSPWQKGPVENGNKMLRWYFPKGTDFMCVTQEQVSRACAIINNKPRKILGYKSALEVATESGFIKSRGVLTEG